MRCDGDLHVVTFPIAFEKRRYFLNEYTLHMRMQMRFGLLDEDKVYTWPVVGHTFKGHPERLDLKNHVDKVLESKTVVFFRQFPCNRFRGVFGCGLFSRFGGDFSLSFSLSTTVGYSLQ